MAARRDKDNTYIVAGAKETTRDFLDGLRFKATLGQVTGTYSQKLPTFNKIGGFILGSIAVTLAWLFFSDFYAAQVTVYGLSAHAAVNLLWPKLFLSGLVGLAGFCLGGLALGWINPREVPVTVPITLMSDVHMIVTEPKDEVA